MMGREDAASYWIIRKVTSFYSFKPCLCDKVAACNWTVAAHATSSRDFVAHSRDKIARENRRCDIGLTLQKSLLCNSQIFVLTPSLLTNQIYHSASFTCNSTLAVSSTIIVNNLKPFSHVNEQRNYIIAHINKLAKNISLNGRNFVLNRRVSKPP